jgi:hypothetical protein
LRDLLMVSPTSGPLEERSLLASPPIHGAVANLMGDGRDLPGRRAMECSTPSLKPGRRPIWWRRNPT